MAKPQSDDHYDERPTARRRDEALRRALSEPPAAAKAKRHVRAKQVLKRLIEEIAEVNAGIAALRRGRPPIGPGVRSKR